MNYKHLAERIRTFRKHYCPLLTHCINTIFQYQDLLPGIAESHTSDVKSAETRSEIPVFPWHSLVPFLTLPDKSSTPAEGSTAPAPDPAPAPSNTDIDDDDDDVFASDDTMTTPAAVAATKNEPESPSKVSYGLCVSLSTGNSWPCLV